MINEKFEIWSGCDCVVYPALPVPPAAYMLYGVVKNKYRRYRTYTTGYYIKLTVGLPFAKYSKTFCARVREKEVSVAIIPSAVALQANMCLYLDRQLHEYYQSTYYSCNTACLSGFSYYIYLTHCLLGDVIVFTNVHISNTTGGIDVLSIQIHITQEWIREASFGQTMTAMKLSFKWTQCQLSQFATISV